LKHRQLCHVSIDKQRNARFLLILALIRFGKSSESAEVGKATDFPTESEAVKIRSAEHNDDAQRRDKEKLVEARTRIRKSKKSQWSERGKRGKRTRKIHFSDEMSSRRVCKKHFD